MDVSHVPLAVDTAAPHGTTNAYVLGSDHALLVDPATRDPDLDALLRDRSVAHVTVTHHHADHVDAVAEYARALDATVWCRDGRETAFRAAAGLEPDRTFREGTTLPADQPVEVLETPGHASEHVAFATDERILCGDTVVADGSVVVGAPEGDLRAYLTTLRRLYARDPERLLPGHGPVIDHPRGQCERLIRHRLDRERRVRAAVHAGAHSPDEIVDAAYEKDVSAVRSLAEATVAAHLEKLDIESKVTWDGSRARPS